MKSVFLALMAASIWSQPLWAESTETEFSEMFEVICRELMIPQDLTMAIARPGMRPLATSCWAIASTSAMLTAGTSGRAAREGASEAVAAVGALAAVPFQVIALCAAEPTATESRVATSAMRQARRPVRSIIGDPLWLYGDPPILAPVKSFA